jgi:DNA replication and repair protein RecF
LSDGCGRGVLNQIRIREFRNLREVDVELAPATNWVVGVNGSGKTAFLEAIYCLSRGRSFRGRRFGSLVTRGSKRARLVGQVAREEGQEPVRWSSDRAGWEDERMAEPFSVRLVCEWTHALVDGDPAMRRRFVDWNLRLWEPRASALFSRFRRLSAQRNAWLRAGATGRPVWDRAYAEGLAEILRLRGGFFQELALAFRALTTETGWFEAVAPQWEAVEADADVIESRLSQMVERDRERGFTYLGASRADYSFRVGLERWVGSRGEGKVVGILMQLAAERVVARRLERGSLWLIDDLDAELSPDWMERLFNVVRQEASQLVVTSLPGKQSLARSVERGDRMFHVEHGRIDESDNRG